MVSFRLIISCLLLGCTTWANAQVKSITLRNASFEGLPHDAVTPRDWQACGLDSSPDILPGLGACIKSPPTAAALWA